MSNNISHSIKIERQFDAFVKRVLRNRHFDYIGRKKREREGMITFPLSNYHNGEDMLKEEMHIIHQMRIDGLKICIKDEILFLSIEKLDMVKKRIVLYFYFLGFSIEEIAALLGMKKNTVKVYKSIAIRELREAYSSFL